MSDPAAAFRSLSRVESGVLGDEQPRDLYWGEKTAGGLTIFIPSWNHRSYLPRSVGSALRALAVLEEAGYAGEVVVADDASRDGSQKLLRSIKSLYGEPRLRLEFLGENRGLPRLRNLGLGLARYRYVLWLDADNELLEENLPLFVRSIEETGATMVYGNLIALRGGELAWLKNNTRATMKLTVRNHVDAFSVVDAERMIRLGGYNPWFYSSSDWEMILHLIHEEEEIVHVPAVLGYYYINPLSMFREARLNREEITALARRMYAQNGTREWDETRVGRLYHPDVGYLDGA